MLNKENMSWISNNLLVYILGKSSSRNEKYYQNADNSHDYQLANDLKDYNYNEHQRTLDSQYNDYGDFSTYQENEDRYLPYDLQDIPDTTLFNSNTLNLSTYQGNNFNHKQLVLRYLKPILRWQIYISPNRLLFLNLNFSY